MTAWHKALVAAKVVLCASFAALACVLCLLALQVSADAKRASGDVHVLASHALAAVDDADAVLVAAKTTVGESDKLLFDARLTLDNINKGAMDERRYFEHDLPAVMAGVQVSVDRTGVLLGDLTATSSAVRGSLGSVGVSVDTSLRGLDVAVRDVDELVLSPAVRSTLTHVDGVATSADAIAADARVEADRFVHPPPKRWWQRAYGFVVDAGKLTYDFVR